MGSSKKRKKNSSEIVEASLQQDASVVSQNTLALNLEYQAMKAMLDGNYQLAVNRFSQAITADPENADLFCGRSQAHIKCRKYTEAVEDADAAIALDRSLSKAYLHKGTALLELSKKALAAGNALAIGTVRGTQGTGRDGSSRGAADFSRRI